MPHLHIIGAGGIGLSALARHYQASGWTISGSDGSHSPLIDRLTEEGMQIHIGHASENLPDITDLVIYSEAIITKPDLPPAEQLRANGELAKALDSGIRAISYPEALSEKFNAAYGIAVAGSHGKSTTSAMIATMLAEIGKGGNAVIGTQIPQFNGSNSRFDPSSDIFTIEACEYRRSFLRYRPKISVITNIDLDHLDYYKDLPDYLSAFESFLDQTTEYAIISGDCENSMTLKNHPGLKIITVYQTYFVDHLGVRHDIPTMQLQVPGDHLAFDANLAFVVAWILGVSAEDAVRGLEAYKGAWRRSEKIGVTPNGNLVFSDYGHHPSEIRPTLKAFKEAYPDKHLFVVFQPHQYSRTRELLEEFATCFGDADTLYIPDIYFSRDKKEDVEWMTVERLITTISKHHSDVSGGDGMNGALTAVQSFDAAHPNNALFLLLGAGNADNLRYQLVSF